MKFHIILTVVLIIIAYPIISQGGNKFDYFEIKTETYKYIGKEYTVSIGKFSKLNFSSPDKDFKFFGDIKSINGNESQNDKVILRNKELAKLLFEKSGDCEKNSKSRAGKELLDIDGKVIVNPIHETKALGKVFYNHLFELVEIYDVKCSNP